MAREIVNPLQLVLKTYEQLVLNGGRRSDILILAENEPDSEIRLAVEAFANTIPPDRQATVAAKAIWDVLESRELNRAGGVSGEKKRLRDESTNPELLIAIATVLERFIP